MYAPGLFMIYVDVNDGQWLSNIIDPAPNSPWLNYGSNSRMYSTL
jgi:hypothetical protein